MYVDECNKLLNLVFSWTKRLQNVELAIADRKKVGAELTDLQLQLAELEVEKQELKTQEEKLKTQVKILQFFQYKYTISTLVTQHPVLNFYFLKPSTCFQIFSSGGSMVYRYNMSTWIFKNANQYQHS